MKFEHFRKSVKKIQISLKLGKNNTYFTWRPIHIFITPCSILLRMRNVSDKSCRENQNANFIFSNTLVRKSCLLWENVENYCRAEHVTDDNMAHVHCMLYN